MRMCVRPSGFDFNLVSLGLFKFERITYVHQYQDWADISIC